MRKSKFGQPDEFREASHKGDAMNFMIRPRKQNTTPVAEPETGRPAGSGEEWLGRNRSSKRRLWDRLNPLSRKQILAISGSVALIQTQTHRPKPHEHGE